MTVFLSLFFFLNLALLEDLGVALHISEVIKGRSIQVAVSPRSQGIVKVLRTSKLFWHSCRPSLLTAPRHGMTDCLPIFLAVRPVWDLK